MDQERKRGGAADKGESGARERDSSDWEIWHNMGLCYMYLKQYDRAIDCYMRANSLGRHDATFLQLGKVYQLQHNYKEVQISVLPTRLVGTNRTRARSGWNDARTQRDGARWRLKEKIVKSDCKESMDSMEAPASSTKLAFPTRWRTHRDRRVAWHRASCCCGGRERCCHVASHAKDRRARLRHLGGRAYDRAALPYRCVRAIRRSKCTRTRSTTRPRIPSSLRRSA